MIMAVKEVNVNYNLARRQQEMVKSRRMERQHTVCSTSCASFRWRHIPLYFLHKNRTILVILYYCSASASPGVIRSSRHHQSPRCFFLSLSCCPLPLWSHPPSFLFLSFPLAAVYSYLATLSCTQHPVCTGAGQTLSLCDAEDISQAITFSAWA